MKAEHDFFRKYRLEDKQDLHKQSRIHEVYLSALELAEEYLLLRIGGSRINPLSNGFSASDMGFSY